MCRSIHKCKKYQIRSAFAVPTGRRLVGCGLYWRLTRGINATLTVKVISWRCASWLSHISTNTTFFPKPLTTFLTCFSRSERRKYAVKKVCLNWASNSQP